jgi:hypothetical protein
VKSDGKDPIADRKVSMDYSPAKVDRIYLREHFAALQPMLRIAGREDWQLYPDLRATWKSYDFTVKTIKPSTRENKEHAPSRSGNRVKGPKPTKVVSKETVPQPAPAQPTSLSLVVPKTTEIPSLPKEEGEILHGGTSKAEFAALARKGEKQKRRQRKVTHAREVEEGKAATGGGAHSRKGKEPKLDHNSEKVREPIDSSDDDASISPDEKSAGPQTGVPPVPKGKGKQARKWSHGRRGGKKHRARKSRDDNSEEKDELPEYDPVTGVHLGARSRILLGSDDLPPTTPTQRASVSPMTSIADPWNLAGELRELKWVMREIKDILSRSSDMSQVVNSNVLQSLAFVNSFVLKGHPTPEWLENQGLSGPPPHIQAAVPPSGPSHRDDTIPDVATFPVPFGDERVNAERKEPYLNEIREAYHYSKPNLADPPSAHILAVPRKGTAAGKRAQQAEKRAKERKREASGTGRVTGIVWNESRIRDPAPVNLDSPSRAFYGTPTTLVEEDADAALLGGHNPATQTDFPWSTGKATYGLPLAGEANMWTHPEGLPSWKVSNVRWSDSDEEDDVPDLED